MNVFDLQAKIGLDSSEYNSGLSKAESGFAALGSKIKSGIGTIAKVTAAGMTAAAAGVAALSKQAVEGYADFEQLSGGVETLFGAGGASIEKYAEKVGKSVDDVTEEYDKLINAQNKVMENANEAYMSAGLSANEYMETVTSFSASLIASLGNDTEKAAEYADRAIIDMADNANKMGSSMESIQNAYQGFAKQNYTMLDNLKLGYGGTQEEMKRLIADTAKMTDIQKELGITVDAESMSFGNIVNAISVMQTKLGIAGTTADEAAKTISGSINMMKASWQNLITGVANDEADFDKLISNFVTSVDTAAKNIIPRIEVALQGVGKLAEKLLPTFLERIPSLLEDTLPTLANSAMAMISTLGQALVNNADQLLLYVVDVLDNVWQGINSTSVVSDGLKSFIETLGKRIPQVFGGITNIALQIVHKLSEAIQNSESIGVIMDAISRIVFDIAETVALMIPEIADAGFALVKGIGQGILDNVPWLLDEVITLVEELAGYIADAAPKMIPKIVELVGQIAEMITRPDAISRLIDAAIEIINGLADGIIKALPVLIEAAPQIIQNIVDAITENLPKVLDCAWNLIKVFTEAIFANAPALLDAGKQIIESVAVGIVQALMTIYGKIDEIAETIADLIREAYHFAVEAAEKNIGKLAKSLVKVLSKIAPVILKYVKKAKTLGINFVMNLIAGFNNKMSKLKSAVSDLTKAIKDKFDETIKKAIDWGKNLIQKIIDGIKNKIATAKQAIGDVTTAIKNKFKETIDNAINWGKDLIQKIIDGIKDKIQAVKDAISDVKKAISDKFEEVIKAAIDWGKNLIGNFVDNVSSKWNEIKNKIFEVKDAIANKFGELVDGAVTWGKQTISHFVTNIVSKWNEIREKVVNVADKVTEIFTGLVNAAQDWGIDMITEFIKGITGSKPELTATIDAIAEIIKARLHHTTPDKGPLANDDTYMPDMMKLFSQGIRQNAYMITDALDSTLYKIQNAFELPHTAIGNVMTANNYAVSDIPKTAEKDTYNGGDNIFNYNITVTSGTIANDYDANRAAQVMAEHLAALQTQQRRAIGL